MDLTEQDYELLDRFRIARLQSEVSILMATALHLDLERELHIFCCDSDQAGVVMEAIATVQEQVWLILGCQHFSVWHNKQVLVRYGFEADLESGAKAFEELGMVATLDKPVVEGKQVNGANAAQAYYPIEQIAQNLATYTKQSPEEMINVILASKPDLRYEGGTYKAPASAGREAFRLWATRMEIQMESGLLPTIEAPQGTVDIPQPTRKATTKRATAKKPAAKKATARKPSTRRKTTETATT